VLKQVTSKGRKP